jgi:hypothetical protein
VQIFQIRTGNRKLLLLISGSGTKQRAPGLDIIPDPIIPYSVDGPGISRSVMMFFLRKNALKCSYPVTILGYFILNQVVNIDP